jgi:hypothetical protein
MSCAELELVLVLAAVLEAAVLEAAALEAAVDDDEDELPQAATPTTTARRASSKVTLATTRFRGCSFTILNTSLLSSATVTLSNDRTTR